MVIIYSHHKLTFSENKLPAPSALASETFRISIENGGEPENYLAGVWEIDLHDQLLGLTDLEQSRDVRCIRYRASSWSWASIECNVLFPDPSSGLDACEIAHSENLQPEIVNCNTMLCCSLLPFGRVTAGRLRVRGCLVHGACILDPDN